MLEFVKNMFSNRKDYQSNNKSTAVNTDGLKSSKVEFNEEINKVKTKKGACGLDCLCFDCDFCL